MMRGFLKDLAVLVLLSLAWKVIMHITGPIFDGDNSWLAMALALGVFAHVRIDVMGGSE